MIIDDIKQAVIDGDAAEVKKLVTLALEQKVSAEEILKSGMIAGMGEVGRLFEEGEYFVPEMLIAARAMQGGLGILRPALVEQDVKSAGKVVIGTVKGDLHDIGKNLVGMMLEGAGFQIVDLGTDVSPDKFIEAIREHAPDIVGMSALLTTTMPNMEKTIQALNDAGRAPECKGHDRRRAGDSKVRQRDWCGRFRARRQPGHGRSPKLIAG